MAASPAMLDARCDIACSLFHEGTKTNGTAERLPPTTTTPPPTPPQIAIEGCCHGELDKIYGALKRLEEKENIKIDLLICCGDFQARRPPRLPCVPSPGAARVCTPSLSYTCPFLR